MARFRGIVLLVLVTILWGTTFVAVKNALPNAAPSVITLVRFAIAAVCFVPFAWGGLRRGSWAMWGAGLELSVWLTLGYALQTIGLEYTTAGRSAFLTALHVVIVPMICMAFQHRSKPLVWVAAAVAFAGTGMLCNDGVPMNKGDAWSAGCAVAWAVYIVRLDASAKKYASLPFTAVQLMGVAVLSLAWAGAAGKVNGQAFGVMPWGIMVYLGVAATALTIWLQTVGQRQTTAPQAAIIFTLEPVWAALFAWPMLDEKLGWLGLTGAGLILGAAVVAALAGGQGGKTEEASGDEEGAGGGEKSAEIPAESRL